MIQLEKKIIKAMGIFVMIFAIAVGILTVTPHHVEAKSKSWKKIYRTFLKKHSLDFSEIGTAHLDKNKIPELITSDGVVFTIKKGKGLFISKFYLLK